jgi:holo-[acyl-carrier protein] synthase
MNGFAPIEQGRTALGPTRLGIDLLWADELDRVSQRPWFQRYVFAPAERAEAASLGPDRAGEFLAGRFAAKEAVLKVLGHGLFEGVAPCDIAVLREAGGAPAVVLRGSALRAARHRGIAHVCVSITHKNGLVAAVATGWAVDSAAADAATADLRAARVSAQAAAGLAAALSNTPRAAVGEPARFSPPHLLPVQTTIHKESP